MVRSIFSNWLGLIVAGVVAIILTPILIQELGDFNYGMWVLVSTIADYYGLLDMGMRVTLQRFVARFNGAQDRTGLNQTFATALALTLGIGALICGASLVLAGVLPGFFKIAGPERSQFSLLVVLLGFSVAVTLQARLLGTYLCGLHRFDLYNLASVVTVVVRAALIIGALRWGYGVVGVAAVTLGTAFCSLPLHWLLIRHVDPAIRWSWKQATTSKMAELIHFSFYMSLTTVGTYLLSYTAPVIIGRVIGVALVTPFNVAVMLNEYFKSVIIAALGPLMPAMSELDGQKRSLELQRLFLRATGLVTLLSLLMGSLLLLNGRSLIHVWLGARFDESFDLMLILLGGNLAAMIAAPAGVLLVARGRHRPLGGWTLAQGVAGVLLSSYWAGRYGLTGVAWGMTVPTLVVMLFIQPWFTLREMELSVREYVLGALARPLLAGTLFLGSCWVVMGSSLPESIPLLAVRCAWQTLLFAGLAVAVGCTAPDRRLVWERLKGVAAGVGLARAEGRI